jgi:hypothetical protein
MLAATRETRGPEAAIWRWEHVDTPSSASPVSQTESDPYESAQKPARPPHTNCYP